MLMNAELTVFRPIYCIYKSESVVNIGTIKDIRIQLLRSIHQAYKPPHLTSTQGPPAPSFQSELNVPKLRMNRISKQRNGSLHKAHLCTIIMLYKIAEGLGVLQNSTGEDEVHVFALRRVTACTNIHKGLTRVM